MVFFIPLSSCTFSSPATASFIPAANLFEAVPAVVAAAAAVAAAEAEGPEVGGLDRRPTHRRSQTTTITIT